ncbi:clan AA aspartic protease [Campylobacter sp. MIT 21-1685]|uniref:clan AA aspartic protease n=1 Tax=unclassified Campylobacter TaxID=2593542 RepID=UPI00224A9911|nr:MULTISPECIES: clan AA aspartic protease [unclassified Campylobacter]MCX2682862.1 clan AA aspartic protease [Campylobacter sp. MIT 21-1684]MCX2751190.1 clan AA aspartic protease [Campylobacter sp. MIT 21-1682]MCX2807343.1 clan AA aspartic protease [Campylobacter sp. MIT 21-1685]
MLFFLRKFFPQLFIAVILEENKKILKASTFRNGKLISSTEKSFEKNENLFDYVKNISKRFLFYYTGLFLDANEQGLIPSKKTENFENFDVGKISLKTFVLNNVQIYTATEHIEYFSDLFEDYNGLDFIYSPFALLYFCIQKEKTDDKTILYIYRYSHILVVMICKNSEILYGEFKTFKVNTDSELENFNDEMKDEEITIKQTDDEEMTLDSFNETNEISDDKFDTLKQEELVEFKDEKLKLDELNQLSKDMEFCRYIITSIEKFYNLKNQTSFIDKAIIFSDKEFNASAIEFLEDETFLELKINQINTLELMIELMQKEISL